MLPKGNTPRGPEMPPQSARGSTACRRLQPISPEIGAVSKPQPATTSPRATLAAEVYFSRSEMATLFTKSLHSVRYLIRGVASGHRLMLLLKMEGSVNPEHSRFATSNSWIECELATSCCRPDLAHTIRQCGRRHTRANSLTSARAFDISRFQIVEDDNRDTMFHAMVYGGGVHDLQILV
jgi:hypothetical protein